MLIRTSITINLTNVNMNDMYYKRTYCVAVINLIELNNKSISGQ